VANPKVSSDIKRKRQARIVMLALAGSIAFAQLPGKAAASTANNLSPANAARASQSSPHPRPPQTADPQREAYKRLMEAEKHAENQVLAAMPGRSWRWLEDSGRTRQDLGKFKLALDALKERQTAFEATLTPGERSRFGSGLRRIHGLSQDIPRDFQSLQDELRKGYPTRWHVEADTWHMYKELIRWEKLDQGIAKAAGIGAYHGGNQTAP
jgi:hypothetical protein